MKLVDMEVQNVKILGAVAHAVKHQHVVGNRIVDIGIEPERRRNAADELRASDGVTAGEQGHLVPHPHQLFGQVRNDTLGSTIEPRRHALHERRDLSNFHIHSSRNSAHPRCALILMIMQEASYLSLEGRFLLQIADRTGAVEKLLLELRGNRIPTHHHGPAQALQDLLFDLRKHGAVVAGLSAVNISTRPFWGRRDQSWSAAFRRPGLYLSAVTMIWERSRH